MEEGWSVENVGALDRREEMLQHSKTPSLYALSRRQLVHLARHEIFVLVPDPITVARDAPDEVQLLLLAEHRMIIEERDGDGIAFTHRMDEAFRLFVRINLHRTAPFGEDINLLLIGVVVRRPGTLTRL